MPDGGRLTVLTNKTRLPKNSPDPTHVCIEFKDSGQGMTAEQKKHAFTSLLSTTKQRGTGLGLALVRRIVEAHSGQIRARSKPGGGTTISVLLPLSD
jgi:two-component system, NtrC family, sensor histidine kinase HydH